MSELLPCPFCGGEAETAIYTDRVGVRCVDVMCAGSHRLPAAGEDAAAAWNTRPANPPATAAGVGEAYVTVPKVPTPEMIRAMCVAIENAEFMDPDYPDWRDGYDAWIPSARLAWESVLSAAPATTPASHDALIARVREVLEFYGDKSRWREFADDEAAAYCDRNTGSAFGDDTGQKARALLTDLDARDGG